MSEQKQSKAGKGGARPVKLQRKGEKATTGRVRARRSVAAYARALPARGGDVQAEIQAAVEAASRIREQIEAKIDKGLKDIDKARQQAQVEEAKASAREPRRDDRSPRRNA